MIRIGAFLPVVNNIAFAGKRKERMELWQKAADAETTGLEGGGLHARVHRLRRTGWKRQKRQWAAALQDAPAPVRVASEFGSDRSDPFNDERALDRTSKSYAM